MSPTAELFDLATGRFTTAGKPQASRGRGATAVRLANGKVLVAGGSNATCAACYLAAAELYDPSTGTFSVTGSMSTARAGAISVLLPSGDVLIVGSTEIFDRSAVATAELCHPGTGTFSAVARSFRSRGQ